MIGVLDHRKGRGVELSRDDLRNELQTWDKSLAFRVIDERRGSLIDGMRPQERVELLAVEEIGKVHDQIAVEIGNLDASFEIP
ncbi:MAG TPA: hypothetical protein VFB45_14900 [Pseudolabrys sp.]|nr:hypothetical protein [Pseudolabrys sp.]